MKELSIEEKAKAYDRVAKEVKDFFEGRQKMYSDVERTLEYLFPELKESEDERIKKTLIDYFKTYKKQEECGINTFFGIPTDNIIAWLEKQGEQKPAWSALDERNLEGIIDEIEANKNFAPASDNVTYDRYLSWLKSLKERYTWKPSDEQMNLLEELVEDNSQRYFYTILKSLYEQLKKLREE